MQASIFLIAKLFVTEHTTLLSARKKKKNKTQKIAQQQNTVLERRASLLQRQGKQREMRKRTKLALRDCGG